MKTMFLISLLTLCFGDGKQYELLPCSLLQKAELFKSNLCYNCTRSISNQNCIKYYRGIFKHIPNPRIGYGFQKANNIKVQLSSSVYAVWEIVCWVIFMSGVHAVSTFFTWKAIQSCFKCVLLHSYYTFMIWIFKSDNKVFDKIHTCWIKVCSHV